MKMVDDLKTLLGPPISMSGDYDGLLEDVMEGVLSGAEEFMGAAIREQEDVVVYFDGGEKTLYLSHFNVSNVKVYVDGEELEADAFTVYPGKQTAGAYIRYVGEEFPAGNRIVRVTYDGGYDEDEYPASLRRKLLKQASYVFRRRNDPGLSSTSSPDGSTQKFSENEWLRDVEEELKRRRRIVL